MRSLFKLLDVTAGNFDAMHISAVTVRQFVQYDCDVIPKFNNILKWLFYLTRKLRNYSLLKKVFWGEIYVNLVKS